MCASGNTGISRRLLPLPAINLGLGLTGTLQVTVEQKTAAVHAKIATGAVKAIRL